MTNLLQEIITLLVGGIQALGTGIGSGLSNAVSSMFITTGEGGAQTLSTFGGIVVIFAAVALAIGLTRLVYNFLTSWGN